MFEDHGHETHYVISGLEENDVVRILPGVGYPPLSEECEAVVLEVDKHMVKTTGPTLFLRDNGGFYPIGRIN